MTNKEAIERLNLVQESVNCIRNTFNQNAENDKLIRNCMALVQNAVDGEYHDMEKVNASEINRPQGEWIIDGHHYKCSRCGKTLAIMFSETDEDDLIGCPFCLAEMWKEEES